MFLQLCVVGPYRVLFQTKMKSLGHVIFIWVLSEQMLWWKWLWYFDYCFESFNSRSMNKNYICNCDHLFRKDAFNILFLIAPCPDLWRLYPSHARTLNTLLFYCQGALFSKISKTMCLGLLCDSKGVLLHFRKVLILSFVGWNLLRHIIIIIIL